MTASKSAWSVLLGLTLLGATACGADGADNAVTGSTLAASTASTTPTASTSVTTAVTAPSLTTVVAPSTETSITEVSITEPTVAEPSSEVPMEVSTAGSTPEPPPEPVTSEAPPPPVTSSTPPPVVNGNGEGTVVVLDAGHNGANGAHPSVINAQVDAGFGETKPCNTTGTETNDGFPEHAFTWSVTNRVKQLLEAAGVTVVMTRDSDDGVGPCVNERAAIGNSNNADAVVSIHGDGSAAGDRGFYAMTSERLPNGADIGRQSVSLATAVRDALVDTGVMPSNYVGSDGLWMRDDLAGLNLSTVPTTMIEMGNMRDADDAAFMKSDAGQDQMAAGIAQGILDYLGR